MGALRPSSTPVARLPSLASWARTASLLAALQAVVNVAGRAVSPDQVGKRHAALVLFDHPPGPATGMRHHVYHGPLPTNLRRRRISQTGSSHEYIHNTHYVYMMCILMGATVISWIHDKNPLRRRHAHDSCAGVMSRMNHVHDGVPSVCMTPCA